MESTIRLVVKTPNQRFKDIHIDCDHGWTVKKLKEYLANVHPTNPESVSQRLIYSGHLLKDDQQLKEVLSKEHNSHTVHIVCPAASDEPLKQKDSKDKPEPVNISNSTASAIPNTDGLRHRNTTNTSHHPYMAGNNQMPRTVNEFNAYWQSYYAGVMQHYHAMYNMQSQPSQSTADQMYQWQLQMMAMYQQTGYPIASTLSHLSPPLTPLSQPSSPTLQQGGQGQIIDGPPVAAAAAAAMEQPPTPAAQGPREQGRNNEQRNANMPMNAGGAMFDDDDENGEERRDWLDWIHTFLRATVMLSIMYFYSSTIRILMISLLGVIIYLYQAGWLTLRRQRADQVENDERIENPNEQEGPQGDEDVNRQAENSEDSDGVDGGTGENSINAQQPQISPFRSHLQLIYIFVTSFFTSLIPQRVQ